jgi:hypothetical protein
VTPATPRRPPKRKSGTLVSGADAERQLARFIDKYTPEVAARLRDARSRIRACMPGAFELVYDNFYALVIGFGPTDRPSEAILSLATYPDHVSLCFLQGVGLDDPQHLLEGSGNQVRHIRLPDPAVLDQPAIRALVNQALEAAIPPWDGPAGGSVVIRAVAARQRPRRPQASAAQGRKPGTRTRAASKSKKPLGKSSR